MHVLWIRPLGMPVCCLYPPSLLQLTHTCLSPSLPHGFTALFFLKAKQIDSCLDSWEAPCSSPALCLLVPCSPVCCHGALPGFQLCTSSVAVPAQLGRLPDCGWPLGS